MKDFNLEDIGNLADRVIDLNNNMIVAFDHPTKQDILKMAIMAGLKDAYDAGVFDNHENMKPNIKLVNSKNEITELKNK